MDKMILTVTELNQVLKTALENDEYFKNVYVIGELSNLTLNKSGHIYFVIKDNGASINCMIWKANAQTLLKLNPKEGMKITCLGRITYYVPTGRVGFEVRDVKIEGKGELQEIFDQRKLELSQAGWFDPSIKKPIPKFPKNIGIITADTGAAIHDLITTMKRRYPAINIFLFPSQVQGEQAQYDIAKKIDQANLFPTKLDILIVGRGGGSYEDLWSFNEMPVLQAVKNSIIPIISAVGHEPDVTLIDYVADLRAPTPTAAAELATPNIAELKRELAYFYGQYKSNITRIYSSFFTFNNQLTKRLVEVMNNSITIKQMSLKFEIEHLQTAIKNKLKSSYHDLELVSQKLILSNPIAPLKKGFALISNQAGKIISSIQDVKLNEELNIKVHDGSIKSTITKIGDQNND